MRRGWTGACSRADFTRGGRSSLGWMIGGLALTGLMGCGQKETPPEAKPEPAVVEASPVVAAAPVVQEKSFTQKVWIIGFDGVDPDWLKAWAAEGKLPAFQKLIETGSFVPLTSTNPPQSPVAWSSFATGTNPGGHGIFDFLRRDPRTYLPGVSVGDVKAGNFAPDGKLTQSPQGVSTRTGTAFWKLAADAGVKTTALNVPYSWPPEPMPIGATLAGLGTPDLRGTNSTFTYFSSVLTDEEEKKGASGGRLVRLQGTDKVFTAAFDGPQGPEHRGTASVTFTVGADGKSVEISLGGKQETVGLGKWSGWFDYYFDVTPQYRVRALGRFYVGSLSPLEVFMYPPNIHPDEPWVPVSSPDGYGAQLRARYGDFKTVGWTHDTSALNAEKLSDKAWMEDVYSAMDRLGELGLGELERDPGSLFIWVETATDRVAHMFTRATDKKSPRFDKGIVKEVGGDPILLTYQRADAILAKVLEKVTPDVTLLVISDHGFHTYRRGLHINSWLLENGYLALKPDAARGAGANLFTAVDWSKTRAYALGTGQIYVNLAGREGQGSVQKADYDALLSEISSKLKTLKDEKTGELPVVEVYKRTDIYKGERFEDAPDLQVAFQEGWRTSSETMLGGIPEGLFADNTKKWSGDHAASDVRDTAGILLSNRKLSVRDPAIVDIAPTVLSIFGVPRPASMEGRDLFAAPAGTSPANPAATSPASSDKP